MESLRILWYNWRCWLNPEMGGAEVFTREVAKRWVDAGHKVTLFTSEFSGSFKEEVLDGIRVVRSGGKYRVYGQAGKFYKDVFSKEHFDVVIDEVNTRPFFTPDFVKGGEKIVCLIHQLAREYWFYETPFPVNRLGYSFFEDRWLKKYADIPTVTVSESTRKDLERLNFRRVFVVDEGLNFTPLENVPQKADHPVVVYAGRLKRAKRPDHAIKAFTRIRDSLPEAELWIFGDGVFKKDLRRLAGDGVKFFGNLNNGDRRALIEKAWVLVNPSIREGFGLNIVEANALGVPCVAYDVNGLRDAVLDGQTGFLAESSNVDALSEAILRLLKDEHLRMKLSKDALVYSRRFNWNDVAEQFLNAIDTA